MNDQWKWKGAKWWKFDFHTHTPASNDYGKGDRLAEYQAITPEAWLIAYMKAEIDCVAITDHNSGAWVDKLKETLNKMREQPNPDFRELYLFPGVEISVSGGYHLLAIFPEDKTSADIATLLGGVGFHGKHGNSDAETEKSLIEVIKKISESGGSAIPAHVHASKGIFHDERGLQGIILETILNEKSIIAMERNLNDKDLPALFQDKKCNWTELRGSDSHHTDAYDQNHFPGSHYSWVKMECPCFEGLKLALLDGDLSVKHQDDFQDDPNKILNNKITKINVKKAKYIGRVGEEGFTLEFNPWLNTIIGSRGTGKSTLLEFIRFGLLREFEIPENLISEIVKYQTLYDKKNKKDGLLEEGFSFSVDYYKDETFYRITREIDKESKSLKDAVITKFIDQAEEKAEGSVPERFPIRIYSQKQIFEMAKEPNALMAIIDDAPEIDYKDLDQKKNELDSAYLSLMAKAREFETKIASEGTLKGELEDVNKKISLLNQGENREILENYRIAQEIRQKLPNWNFETIREKFTELLINFSFSAQDYAELEALLINIQEKEGILSELYQNTNEFKKRMDGIGSELADIQAKINRVKTDWENSLELLRISKFVKSADQSFVSLNESLKSQGIDVISGYSGLIQEKQEIEAKLKSFDQVRTEIQKSQSQAAEVLAQIISHRNLLTQRRKDFLSIVLAENDTVQIKLKDFGNRSAAEEWLRDWISRTKEFEDDVSLILDNIISHETITVDDLDAEKKRIIEIHKGTNHSIKHKGFKNLIMELDPEKMDRLMIWFPDDGLDISYKIGSANKFKPIQQGSPGQKTAALLAFILSYGTEPLILDQPEDDLDNKLIYDLVVANIREMKLSRQIIIITHNANIVVNGDAENVMVLNTPNGQTQVTQGCLQNKNIRDEICQIMEGGQEALEKRYKRIVVQKNIP